ncbi:host attachment protein [Marinobacter nauticus]|uniref:host attachment protein n=1 Tax=Marinobacter nauticus TaxID=2743 RepID=UPI0039C8EDEB
MAYPRWYPFEKITQSWAVTQFGLQPRVGGYQSYDREPSEDPEEQRFAAQLSEQLEKARHEGHFDNLVLIAPPEFLGVLRHQLSKDCMAAVVKSIDKDLVRQETDSIIEHLDL